MPHFIIALILYINLLNLSSIKKCLFLSNMEPLKKLLANMTLNVYRNMANTLIFFADKI